MSLSFARFSSPSLICSFFLNGVRFDNKNKNDGHSHLFLWKLSSRVERFWSVVTTVMILNDNNAFRLFGCLLK